MEREHEEQKRLEEQEAELARKIHSEIRYVSVDPASKSTKESSEESDPKSSARQERRRKANTFFQLLTGNILVNEGVARYYPHMIAVAAISFVSIAVMFFSLHMDMRYSRLEREVQLLRERSLRFKSDRHQRCSHSAIIQQLQQRGISLEESQAASTLID